MMNFVVLKMVKNIGNNKADVIVPQIILTVCVEV